MVNLVSIRLGRIFRNVENSPHPHFLLQVLQQLSLKDWSPIKFAKGNLAFILKSPKLGDLSHKFLQTPIHGFEDAVSPEWRAAVWMVIIWRFVLVNPLLLNINVQLL